MPPRQVWLFKFGCWAAFLASVMHLIGYFVGFSPANDAERALLANAEGYLFVFPGGSHRSLMDLYSGFSLAFVLQLAGMGGIGLVVAKRGYQDEWLMAGVARASALIGAVLLVISMVYFFVIPSMFIMLMTTAYALAAVRK